MNENDPRSSVHYLSSSENKAKKKKFKKKGLYGIWTYDLSNADEAVYQLS